MSTTGEEISVEVGAVDAAAAKKEPAEGASTIDAPVVVTETGGTDDKPVLSAEDGLKKLSQQLEEERAARIAAESRANDAAAGEAKARGEVQASQLDQLKSAMSLIDTERGNLRAQRAEALRNQDYDTEGEINDKIADLAAKRGRLEASKEYLERQPKPVARAPTDPVEAYISDQGISAASPSAAWLRAHPQFARDEVGRKQLLHAHNAALVYHKVESPGYFKAVEELLKVAPDDAARHLPAHHDDPPPRKDDPSGETAAVATGGRSVAPAAAPVSRSGNGAGGRPNTVRLGPQQREAAKANFPDSKNPDQEYAKYMTAEEIKRGPF